VEEVVARTTDLQTLLPDLTLTHTLFMRYVYTSPANPDLMLLMAMSNNQSGNLANHYFLVERKPEGADIFLIREVAFNSYARFSPNGRLLLFVSNNPISSSSNAALDIVNLETGQEQHLVTRDGGLGSDWSADGNWLVQLYEQYLLLMAPAYNYEQIIPGDFASCGNVIWVNK
jgi:dipeptidyl aminopeptidase/acylaminoacyl peptidase